MTAHNGPARPSDPGLTAADWLRHHTRLRPDAPAVTRWSDGAAGPTLSFRELGQLVARCAAGLTALPASPGDRVLLVLPNDETFGSTLLAVIALGLVAVPAPTPDTSRPEAFRERLSAIAADCRPSLVIAPARWEETVRAVLGGPDGDRTVRSWEELAASPPARSPGHRATAPGAVAFLQYSSGSTGTPKGVAVSHRALRASCAQAAAVYRERPTDTAVTWVPLHHDMGLVTGVLRPLFTGYRSVLLPPREFVRDPGSWLSAVSACQGTLSSAPDFAYERCTRRIPQAEADAFRLASWRVARNAGEVVRAATAERFAGHFAAAGFRASSFCPSYGMAEATLTVTTATPDVPPLRLTVRQELLHAGVVLPVGGPADPGGPSTVLLSSGTPLPDTAVEIRDAPDGGIGDIHIRGPQLFSGYWSAGRPPGPPVWHPTGDRGFLHDGHLFVVGRSDDVLIHHGRQHYPADVLAVCAGITGLRPGRCAVFAHRTEDGTAATDRVCLVAEVEDGAPPAAVEDLVGQVRRRLARAIDLYVADVVLVPAGRLPVTTSGKVRTAEAARLLHLGLLPPVPAREAAHATCDDPSTGGTSPIGPEPQ